MINEYRRGLLMATVTAVIWGATGPIAKIISTDGLSQITVAVYRTIFIVLAVGSWLYFRKGAGCFRVSRNMMAGYVVMGFLSIVCTGTGYMMSCVYLPVPQAVILHYTFPLLTIAGDYFITKEKPTLVQLIGAILIIVGLYVGFAMGHGLGDLSVIGLVWGTVSVFGFAGQNLLTRVLVKDGRSDPIVQLFYMSLFGGIMVTIGKSLFLGWDDLHLITPRIFALMQYPTIMSGLLGFALLYSSMQYIPATMASLLCSLEVVSTLAAMPLLLGVWPTMQETAGALIILFAVGISAIGKRKRSVPVIPKAAVKG